MAVSSTRDVVDVLLSQHEQIKEALAKVPILSGPHKAAAFDRLRALLHAHETAEQEIVHPATRDYAGEGDIAGHRVAEEVGAEAMLARLTDLGSDHADFDAEFMKLHDAVLQHAEREEVEEFPQLRKVLAPDLLVSLAERLRAAEMKA